MYLHATTHGQGSEDILQNVCVLGTDFVLSAMALDIFTCLTIFPSPNLKSYNFKKDLFLFYVYMYLARMCSMQVLDV